MYEDFFSKPRKLVFRTTKRDTVYHCWWPYKNLQEGDITFIQKNENLPTSASYEIRRLEAGKFRTIDVEELWDILHEKKQALIRNKRIEKILTP